MRSKNNDLNNNQTIIFWIGMVCFEFVDPNHCRERLLLVQRQMTLFLKFRFYLFIKCQVYKHPALLETRSTKGRNLANRFLVNGTLLDLLVKLQATWLLIFLIVGRSKSQSSHLVLNHEVRISLHPSIIA